jgi:perosamine synthetase
VAGLYEQALDDLDGVELPAGTGPDGARRSWFVYVVKLPHGVDRDGAIEALRARGIDSKPYLPSIHLMSFYRDRFGHKEGEFPNAEDASRRCLALPFFPQLTEGEVAQVADALREVLAAAPAL